MRLFSELLQTHPVAHMESGPLWSFTHITVAITLCVFVCVCFHVWQLQDRVLCAALHLAHVICVQCDVAELWKHNGLSVHTL